MKLNLGGGDIPLRGYVNLDRKTGQEIYPLDYEDGTAAEIRASHCLEHFSHRELQPVLNEWVRVLEPGGVLKIAVPDFAKIAQWYVDQRRGLPLQSYIIGGQTDENDFHKAIFDVHTLAAHLAAAGLTDIKPWTSEIDDNASWEVSLNLQGTKPSFEGWPASQAANIYSQHGEDGILAAIFNKIGATSRHCVDVGAADGLLFSNVRQFIEAGWKGLLIESDETRFQKLGQMGGQFGKGQVICYNYKVEPTGARSLEKLLEKAGVPEEFDLLSIDVDGQEYYLWNSLLRYRPRVVVVEFDPAVDPMYIPPLNGPGQAGWTAIAYVAAARGYTCISKTQNNLVCIRREILDGLVADGEELVITERGDDHGHASDSPGAGADTLRPAVPAVVASDSEVDVQPDENKPVKIIAVASVPRLGFNATWHGTLRAMMALGIRMEMVEGAFWGQCLTRALEKALSQGAEQILTVDYDTVFDVQHVAKLCQLLADNDDFDIIVPVQMKRECEQVLMQMNGSRDFSVPLTPIKSGHFGLTVFDASAFEKIPKPWFQGIPSPAGDWGDGHVDDDMHFWAQCEKAKVRVGLANEVRVGHLELGISWPSDDFRKVRQSVTEYRTDGQPPNCGGGLKIDSRFA